RAIERWQRHGLVADDLDGGAALAEEDDGTESRIVHDAEDELEGIRLAHHLLHGEAIEIGGGTQMRDACDHARGRLRHGLSTFEAERDAAHIAFMRYVG